MNCLVILLVFVLACLGCSSAIRCFTCDDCSEPFYRADKGVGELNCLPGEDACMKIMNIKNSTQTDDLSRRLCGQQSSAQCKLAAAGENGCLSVSTGSIITVTCCCTGDLCNAASTPGGHVVALAALMLLAVILAGF